MSEGQSVRVIQMEFTLWLCMHTRGAWQQPAECTQIPKNTLDSSRGHVIATAMDLTAPVGSGATPSGSSQCRLRRACDGEGGHFGSTEETLKSAWCEIDLSDDFLNSLKEGTP